MHVLKSSEATTRVAEVNIGCSSRGPYVGGSLTLLLDTDRPAHHMHQDFGLTGDARERFVGC
jgi:hypothetical protein